MVADLSAYAKRKTKKNENQKKVVCMRKNNSRRKNRFLALCLSVMMLGTTAAALAACSDDTTTDDDSTSTESTESTSTPKDTGIIKNMGFELDDMDDETLIKTSVTGWTRAVNSATSGSALSSKAASGVVDTAAWDDLTTSKLQSLGVTLDELVADEEKAANNWDKLTSRDKLAYYEAWEKANEDDDEADIEDLEFYQSFNIDFDDLPLLKEGEDDDAVYTPIANPGTHYASDDTANKDNTKVLMIHNEYSNSTYDKFGTAQKYTSSSTVTVAAGTRAEFSLWVKTSDLTSTDSYGNEQPAVNKGAYISVTNTVGGKTMDPVEIVNINTDGEWAQYSFTLQSASFADSTFTIVLGLGKGGGTDRSEYVNGYAFFDDITCTTAIASKIDDDTAIDFDSDKFDRTLDATKKSVVIDYSDSATADKVSLSEYAISSDLTKETIGSKDYTAKEWLGLNWSYTNDVKGEVLTGAQLKAMTANNYAQTVYNNYLGADEDATEMFVFLSASGASYTAEVKAKNADHLYTLQDGEYMAISFFVKTSNINGFTGAGVTVVDGETKTSISSIDTTSITAVDLIGADGKTTQEDIHNGWQQCFLFLSNDTEEEQSFYLEFTLGPTAVQDTTESSYYPAFAAFKDFQVYNDLSKDAYDCASSGTYTSVVSLVEESDEAAGDSGFDSPMGVPSDAIENGYAFPKNYRGVYAGDGLVNGEGTSEINQHPTAGLLNKEHAENDEYKKILETLGGTGATWNSVFGSDVTQPLVIYNETAQEKSYGYIGATTSLSASAYTTISMRIKTSAGAKASVYLIDTDDKTRSSSISIGAKTTYWYDDDGNICVSDPSKSSFNEKKDIAFKLQSNGLYKVNTKWSGASAVDANAYYANLSAYTEKDEDQNLLVAENGVSYDYTDNWLNDGNDGIAYYYKEGKYYADSNYKTLVNDLSTVSGLPVRTEAQADKALQYTEIDTNGQWALVTFYIHTGDVAKNYRLEVWSGTRDGSVKNGANSYVMFDAYKPTDVDATSFANLIKERQDLTDDYFESVFSFYDTDRFLRYDETADENEVGNSYESYLSSAYTKSVAYLNYKGDNVYETYADYALSEVEVAADAEETDDSTDESDDETDGETTNVWLLASSIAIAAVLVLAVASLIIRKAVKNARKKRGVVIAPKAKKVKKSKKNED